MTDPIPEADAFDALVGTSEMEDMALIAQARAMLEQDSSQEEDEHGNRNGRQPNLDTVSVLLDSYNEPTVLARFTFNCNTHGLEHGFVTKAATGQYQIYGMQAIDELIEVLQGFRDDAVALGWDEFAHLEDGDDE
jgi:hypothetical protein